MGVAISSFFNNLTCSSECTLNDNHKEDNHFKHSITRLESSYKMEESDYKKIYKILNNREKYNCTI
jgi:hypothetical protein